MTIEGDKAIIHFSNCGSGLTIASSPYTPKGEKPKNPKKLTGFCIAGEDRKFVWADAVIDGDRVIVSSPKVLKPVAVRYGFSNSPVCNLYNKELLPASPFRTDNWEK